MVDINNNSILDDMSDDQLKILRIEYKTRILQINEALFLRRFTHGKYT